VFFGRRGSVKLPERLLWLPQENKKQVLSRNKSAFRGEYLSGSNPVGVASFRIEFIELTASKNPLWLPCTHPTATNKGSPAAK